MQGRVYKSTGLWYNVTGEDGQTYQCRIRGKLKLSIQKVSNPIAVGDYVTFHVEKEEPGKAVIQDILPRKNYIIRKATKKSKQSHMLASNLDQAILMVTFKYPKTSIGFIDRFLVTAESFRIPVIILINKSDLLSKEDKKHIKIFVDVYEPLGYKCRLISIKENNGFKKFTPLIHQQTSLIAGHSGVGKSSLLNKLIPDLMQRTAPVSDFADKGVHATTFAEMFEVEKETYLIDTPGIKELGLLDIAPEELGHYLPEMRQHLGGCKYHNCTHTHEPGCIIVQEVEAGNIALSRYESYLSMYFNEDNRN